MRRHKSYAAICISNWLLKQTAKGNPHPSIHAHTYQWYQTQGDLVTGLDFLLSIYS